MMFLWRWNVSPVFLYKNIFSHYTDDLERQLGKLKWLFFLLLFVELTTFISCNRKNNFNFCQLTQSQVADVMTVVVVVSCAWYKFMKIKFKISIDSIALMHGVLAMKEKFVSIVIMMVVKWKAFECNEKEDSKSFYFHIFLFLR